MEFIEKGMGTGKGSFLRQPCYLELRHSRPDVLQTCTLISKELPEVALFLRY